jgi:hypothetical protein
MSAEHDELAEAEWFLVEADKAWSDEAWRAKRKRMLAAPPTVAWRSPEPTADPDELWRAFVRDFLTEPTVKATEKATP